MFFGVRYAERFIFDALSSLTAVTGALADGVAGILPTPNVPQTTQYPALVYFPDGDGTYGGPTSGTADSEVLRMRVHLIDEGYDDAAILPAAEAMAAALDAAEGTIDGVYLTCHAVQESAFRRRYVESVEGAAVPTVELGVVFEFELSTP